jgi:hypothetical protein
MKNAKKLTALLLLLVVLGGSEVWAFCGFYVAKAGAELFNNKSQIILVRDGDMNVITMASDFKGNVKDFAMVVPVPVVLKQEDIKVVYKSLFDKLDAYSAPRLVEYYDGNPCEPAVAEDVSFRKNMSTPATNNVTEKEKPESDKYSVTIEAQYSVEEYEILILSAQESDGLKRWLTDNGYSIPAKAEEVLEPYIKNNMKFFVVKVNLEKQKMLTDGYLRPIQIRFKHDRFMLPIRLGMANGNGEQDMIVYAFTKNGRIETANYRTVKVPTNRNIPLYVQQRFDRFYADLYNVAHKKEGRNAIFLEYAWNLSPYNYLKCDPCVGEVPNYSDMITAGVDWLKQGDGINTRASVFFTRLHVRYTRNKFPQDLTFMETPNTENFQGRYILTHPATGNLSCDEGQRYLADLHLRRQRENLELASLTGWNMSKYQYYPGEFDDLIKVNKTRAEVSDTTVPTTYDEEIDGGNILPADTYPPKGDNNQWQMLFYITLVLFVALSIFQLRLMVSKNSKIK